MIKVKLNQDIFGIKQKQWRGVGSIWDDGGNNSRVNQCNGLKLSRDSTNLRFMSKNYK